MLVADFTDDRIHNYQNGSTLCFGHMGKNYVFVFTGRWRYLRVQFPYLFTNLRANGGVIDYIHYLMINYDDFTQVKLESLASMVNNLAGYDDTVGINYIGYRRGHPPSNPSKGAYAAAYYDYINGIIRHPCNRYFKVDDDVVYIHPGTFENILSRDHGETCSLRFANIAGANWRCSFIHQTMGIYNDSAINPNGLHFQFHTNGKCGWSSLPCAQLSLDAFIFLYKRKQLNKYLFNGTYLLTDKMRFSINFFMIDSIAIDLKALAETWPIGEDDEDWWTRKYAQKTNPHCIVGNSLVVHFSYSKTAEGLEQLNMVKEFEAIVVTEMYNKVPLQIWSLLEL